MQKEFVRSQFSFIMESVELDIAAINRDGELSPIVFLHGFGSMKDDYADIVRYSAFAGHPFLAYDAPGCGESHCSDLSQISIPFLVETALAVLEIVFSADKSSTIQRLMPSGSWMTSLSEPVIRQPILAPYMHPTCAIKFGPTRYEGSSSPWSELSDYGDLINKFLGLPCPKMFMYGEEFPIKKKGMVLATYVSATLAGGLLGRVLCGFITEHFNWE
ncbi:alpha/beta fold hydrolase [Paenibacillus sabinae]|uniref:Putative alpha/beta hydrolase n=1 Tax=Paenibacillus sabinae T27 TaxID=1268072 RepID=X4ZZ43_9BACL|nr:alpha/beta hydrolase [Paenibacillus sabinae]AHV96934.1 putative alpha/beta hydrolase [Paenibacillus sabinae T27]